MTIADTLREARFIIPDRDVPGCGWICFKDADGLISPIDYVGINHFPHIPVRPSGGENVMDAFEKWFDAELGHLPNSLATGDPNVRHWLSKAWHARDETITKLVEAATNLQRRLDQHNVMDVRAWIEQQVETAVSGEADILRQRMHIVNVLAPTITKLAEALTRLQKEAGALIVAHEIALRQDSGNTNIACLQLRIDEANDALDELEKP